MPETDWYDTRWGRLFYWGVIGATLVAVGLSITGTEVEIPVVVYLFGFLGASVYAMTSFAKQFDATGRYRLKILSRTIAVLPLATGVYLLSFAFAGGSGQLDALNASVADNKTFTQSDRLVAGLIFLAGIYVSATLRALGGLAERMLGLSARQHEDDASEGGPDDDDSRPPQ